jgi:uncharacterized protein YodC (DUF2158 family)
MAVIGLSCHPDKLLSESTTLKEQIMDLRPGDVVMLKSGGHPLTVAEIDEDAVTCIWMGDAGDLFRETLPLAVLELAEIDTSEDDEEEEEDEEDEDEDEAHDDKVA